ncbi:cysteine-rich CWC family protein [Reinekea sp.]|uniref:cysteine-rich CWC family protein n=1 Tax=Reinekea sp. TaxID=1970455 RepID=UPI003988B9B8
MLEIKVAELQCPFCLETNNCQVRAPLNCWCNRVEVPEQLLAMVPESLKQKACICANCIELYHKDPERFSKT